jgi:hypothetical protein
MVLPSRGNNDTRWEALLNNARIARPGHGFILAAVVESVFRR